MLPRKPYPSDVSDDEWSFVAPNLTLLSEAAGHRRYALHEVFNGVRYIVKTRAHWRMLPHDMPSWPVVYQQMRRWVVGRSFVWTARFRRLAREYERLAATLASLRFLAFTCIMLYQFIQMTLSSYQTLGVLWLAGT